METRKENILTGIRVFVRQRPGIDFEDYRTSDMRESIRAYRQDCRAVHRQLKDAETLFRAISWRDSIDADQILEGLSRGRFTCAALPGGKFDFDFTPNQDYRTEYRGAVAAALAHILWEHARSDYKTGDGIRAYFKKEFGRGLAKRYFN